MEKLKITGFSDEISPDVETQITVLKKLKIHHMEIRGINGKGVDTYSEKDVMSIKKILDDSGIKISALASPIGKYNIDQPFEPHFEHFKHVVELAHILETSYIRIFSFFIPPNELADRYETKVMEQLEQLITYATEQNIILLHENEKDIYGDTIDRCQKLMKKLYGKYFRATFDFANFIQCGQDVMQAFNVLLPYIEYVHIKDARVSDGIIVPAGNGDGRIQEILKELIKNGYSGYLSLEPHLAEFAGLENLEREGASLQGMKKIDGEVAFTFAWDALKKILKNL